ncbi:MAG TPA: TIGR03960 family B12-binding radical SAM protein, partial [Phycisphaerae bacterium]|nr:TIGR03960 family B12-binding radical SAM protein [Phycisphaerae bacterium]
QIIYWICNHIPGVCAERVYAPWLDAEQIMRQRQLPLFTWDTRQPVADADIFAISLQYEMGFSNVLMMLDLAGIPLRGDERSDAHPLIVGGGPQADNPEPLADFLDLVVIGDGEHSMTALVELVREMKRQGASRRDMILEAARRFEWIYAPSLYAFDYHADGRIASVTPSSACPAGFVPRMHIERCQTPDFETVAFPTRPLVPFTQIVHDRISIEVMRGCPQRCRFCHAGYTKRPLGLRSVDRILEIAEEAWRATGHEEIGLLSLSTADYPHLQEFGFEPDASVLAERMQERFDSRHVNLSVPSLRVDKMLANIPWLVSSVRKSGLTVAVEAAADDLRAAIRKKVTDGNLLDGMRAAYEAGYNSVKLYFMCGFPGERREDIEAIFELARQVSEAKRGIRGGPASVNASVGWLVPKAHTPFQWAAQKTVEYFEEARSLLRQISSRYRTAVRIKTHRPHRSILEGVFARGDRRLGAAIEAAYRLGARMDGWDEAFNYDIWQRAFEQTGIDPAFYAHRERSYTEILPWDHIAGGGRREYLQGQYDDVFVKLGTPREPATIDG